MRREGVVSHYEWPQAPRTIAPSDNRNAAMKVNPERHDMILDLSTRLAPVVPDGSAARERRRIESGVRASFALRPSDAITHASSDALIARRTRIN